MSAPAKKNDLDRRLHAFRPDLADIGLKDRISSQKFVSGTDHLIATASAPIHRASDSNSMMETEALLGEKFRVFEQRDGWSWGQLESDGYVGYVPTPCLSAIDPKVVPTHKLVVPRSFVYPKAELRDPPILTISMGAEFEVIGSTRTRGTDYSVVTLPDGRSGSVISRHLIPLEDHPEDWVALAETFLHTPYLWGGRTSIGLDCSALVQVPRMVCGLEHLRDSDMQARLGRPVPLNKDYSDLDRGDLVFWPGHVAIMLNGTHIIHANGYHMATEIESLHEAATRIAAHYGPISHARRLD